MCGSGRDPGRWRQFGRTGRRVSGRARSVGHDDGPGARSGGQHVPLSDHRIGALPNITLLTETQITALGGEADLETVRWTGPAGEDQAPLRHVFLFASADPASDRLFNCGVALDARGFVLSGQDGGPCRDDRPSADRGPRYLYLQRGRRRHHAQLTYSRMGQHLIIIDDTEVADTLRGKGIGRALVEQAVEDARRLGHRIVPLCPFARSQFQRFPQW